MAGLFEDKNVEIFSSRERIRNELVEFAQRYLELQSVDLFKTSFVSYIINVLSTLSSNQMFYSSGMYKEFFMTEAQMRESVVNLAKWIGYNAPKATPSTVDVLFNVPLSFSGNDVTFTIPSDYQVTAGDIAFTINNEFIFRGSSSTSGELDTEINDMVDDGVTARVLNNRLLTITDSRGFFYPVRLDISQETPVASFLLPFKQIEKQFLTFQVPSDLEFYRFFSKRITGLTGQLSDANVYVVPQNYTLRDPNTNQIVPISVVDSLDSFNTYFANKQDDFLWTESEGGLFTLSQDDREYLLTIFDTEAEFQFGNGVIGAQPERGSTVFLDLGITRGLEGNVIPGSITGSDDLYYVATQGSTNTRVMRISKTVVNTVPASGGSDQLSISEIKSNAITNLRSKERLVSDGDYIDFEKIVKDVPLEETLPILKRSDLKINEIAVFSQLVYANPANDGLSEIVPTRNIIFPSAQTDLFIPRGSVPTMEGVQDFETLFNMEINTDNNTVTYEYVLSTTSVEASIVSSDNTYNRLTYLFIPTMTFSVNMDPTDVDLSSYEVIANVNHTPTAEITEFRAYITPSFTGDERGMTTNLNSEDSSIVDSFSIDSSEISDNQFLDVPRGEVKFSVRVEGLVDYDSITEGDKRNLGILDDPTKPDQWFTISEFSSSIILRNDLSAIMTSTVTENDDGSYVIHNVPSILSSYLNQQDFNTEDFELVVLQKLAGNLSLSDKRMLTDFINIKFPDTIGDLTNMKYNPTMDFKVISDSLDDIPLTPDILDSYIVNGSEGVDVVNGNWNKYVNYIAQWNGSKWNMIRPKVDDFIEYENKFDVTDDKNGDRLIFTGKEWIEPVFSIPFLVSLRITKDPRFAISSAALVNNIKSALLNEFVDQFGNDKDIDISEILSVARNVEGVRYASILEPKTNIRFRYEIKDLPQTELLDYTPQLVAFTEDTISISIIETSV